MNRQTVDPALLFLYPEIAALGETASERRSEMLRIAAATRPFEIAVIDTSAIGESPQSIAPSKIAWPAPGARRKLFLLPIRDDDDAKRSIERALFDVASNARVIAKIGVVPYFFSDANGRPPQRGGAVPPWPSYGGVFPSAPLDAEMIDLQRRLVRAVQPRRLMHHLLVENCCLLNVDWGADVAARRFSRSTPSAARTHRALIVAIEGSDGVGKSTHVAALADRLSQKGLIVAKKKMYRHGIFHDTVTRMTKSAVGNENLHIWRIERTAKIFDSVKYFHSSVAPDLDRCDVIVFDRYVETHAAAAVGRCHYDPSAMELLEVYPEADVAFLLDAPAEMALERIDRRSEKTVDEHPFMITRYRHAFLGMAHRQRFRLLDATAPFEENHETIVAAVLNSLEKKRSGT